LARPLVFSAYTFEKYCVHLIRQPSAYWQFSESRESVINGINVIDDFANIAPRGGSLPCFIHKYV
jgi:hypothetical protein